MAAVLTVNFIELPSVKSDPLEQEVSELRSALARRDQQLSRLEKQVASLAEEESHTEEALKTLGFNNRKFASGSPEVEKRSFGSIFAPKASTADKFPNGMPKSAAPGEFVPDLSKYVSRMAIIDEHGCSSGQQWNEANQMCEFGPILRMPTISPEDLEYYFNIGRPIILTNFTPQWKANENWTPERLKRTYGHLTVNVQKGRAKNKNFETEQHLLRRDMNFGQFIDDVMKNENKNDLYLTANNNLLHKKETRGLLKDMEPFYDGFLSVDPHQTHFWFGAEGQKTPLHFDPISLFHTHVKGRKLWKLWPPEMAPYLYHREKVYSEVDSYNPDHAKFPLFKHAFHAEEIIGEGETLFIPTGWWHTVDSLDTPTVTLSATSWVPKYYRYESRLRVKWPQKGAHPPNSPKGPALPGESTPRNFDIHDWAKSIAVRHQKLPALPATAMEWSMAVKAKDADTLRPVLERYSSEDISRSEAFLFMVLNPLCSSMPMDWKAWIVENLGLGNSPVSLVSVISRDGDAATLNLVQTALTKCLAEGARLWDAPSVDATAAKHGELMAHIHGNQDRLHKTPASQKDTRNWNAIRHVNHWKPPDEYTIQKSGHYPGAEVVSDTPRLVVVRGFLTEGECDDLMAKAEPNLIRSTVIGAETDNGKVTNDRTSMGAWLSSSERAAGILEQKASRLTGLDVTTEEGVHVLRYHEGENYNRHLDGCDVASPDGSINPECERFLRRSGDRIASVVVMLDPPEQGGATAFPRVKKNAEGKSVFNMNTAGLCSDPDTLQVQLNKGDAVLFWGYHPQEEHPDGKIDWASEHTGCKVEKGQSGSRQCGSEALSGGASPVTLMYYLKTNLMGLWGVLCTLIIKHVLQEL
eukprot:CAMPEP_0118928462 /NCGR_PEP_ID=MMETSP1169-20130426/5697_1 /TAXON_ID=36882 /ORGANISM="Pyramimonas obovata, Strain CCMP722" /LENGTH=864 /DNA_ID=CAMNT_0006870437 /DNA_START=251 /DNA_END=2842 /DNA_ORIENTATION=-